MAEPDPFAHLSELTGSLYRTWEEAMEDWWGQALGSPAFRAAMAENMASHTQARGAYQHQVDRTMEQLHLPSRADLVRLTRIATLLEDRLLGMEDRLLGIEDRLEGLEIQLGEVERELLKARLDAAEALVALAPASAEPAGGD